MSGSSSPQSAIRAWAFLLLLLWLASALALVVPAWAVTAPETIRVSVSSTGAPGNSWSSGSSISANGRFVAFESLASNLVEGDTNGFYDVFVHDRTTGQTTRVSVSSTGAEANSASFFAPAASSGSAKGPSISADGRFVTFSSYATNLVPGTPPSGECTNSIFPGFCSDVFVRGPLR